VPFEFPRKAAAVIVGLALLGAAAGGARAADEQAVKRGQYLFVAAASCHTDAKNNGPALAGGPPLTTPFGTFFGPNITPDPEFGIGRWSEADFHRALRDGIGRDGDYLYPVFPFTSFTRMTDGDIADLYAYLMAQPPFAAPSKPHRIAAPFSWRWTLPVWRALFFREGALPPAEDRDAEWTRGRYLAEAVVHCQECHTPRNLMGALDDGSAYSGNPHGPDKQNAPNITSDRETGIGAWSVDDVVALLESGQTPDFDYVGSGMAQVVKGTGELTPADRRAIAVYIKSLPPIHGEKRQKVPE
jgi:mono/diheme cytochrome c family protein